MATYTLDYTEQAKSDLLRLRLHEPKSFSKVKRLIEELNSAYRLLLDQLSKPSMRTQVFAIADALIGGRPIPSSGGGGGSTSDLRWDGRNPDEEEDAYRRRCLLQATKMVGGRYKKEEITLSFCHFAG